MSVICPYENISRLSLYTLIDGQTLNLKSDRSMGHDKTLFFPNLSSRVPLLDN